MLTIKELKVGNIQKPIALSPKDYVEEFNKQEVDYENLSDMLNLQTTKGEREALRVWTGSEYRSINNHLRNGASVTTECQDTIDIMHKALARSKYPEMYVRRGATVDYINKLVGSNDWQKDPNILKKGTFTDKGFLATTPNKYGGLAQDVMIYYKVPKDAKALYIDSISRVRGEYETLFIDHTKMYIRDVRITVENNVTKYTILADIL